MPVLVEFLPQEAEAPARHGMQLVAGKICQRLQDKSVTGDLFPRDLPSLAVDDLVPVKEEIQVQRPRPEFFITAFTSAVGLYRFQGGLDLLDSGVCVEGGYHIQELVALETHRPIAVDGGQPEHSEVAGKSDKSRSDMLLRVHIAADSHVNLRHRNHPLSFR